MVIDPDTSHSCRFLTQCIQNYFDKRHLGMGLRRKNFRYHIPLQGRGGHCRIWEYQ